jgi:NAD(P)H-dependent FMN reductase
MPRIGVILGSTRPNRNGEQVARWVLDRAARRSDADFALVDLREYPLPHLDEPLPALETMLDQVVAWSAPPALLHTTATD